MTLDEFTLADTKYICFTGHRPKNPNMGGYDWNSMKNLQIQAKLRETILMTIDKVPHVEFICGGALGIDQMAFAISYMLKQSEQGKQIDAIHLAIPYEQNFTKWNRADIERQSRHIKKADKVIFVDELPQYQVYGSTVGQYHPEKLQQRNKFMVDQASIVIAVWDGSPSGTANCVRYAREMGRSIIYIDPTTLEITTNRKNWWE